LQRRVHCAAMGGSCALRRRTQTHPLAHSAPSTCTTISSRLSKRVRRYAVRGPAC
jgi:hypothetical protein